MLTMTSAGSRNPSSGRKWAALLWAALFFSSAVPAGELRIGYVNMAKVIEEAPQGDTARKKLKTEFTPRDQELVALQARIRQREEGLLKNSATLTENDRRTQERELFAMKRELKRTTQEFREDYNHRHNEEMAALQKIVHKAILEIAKQERYDLVLQEGAVFASDAVDITGKVLKKLGKQ